MPKLTKVTQQHSRSPRVNLFVDGKFLAGLDQLVWLQLRLQVGDSLSPTLIERIVSENASGKCYDRALRLLSMRPQSRFELNQKLARRHPPDHIAATLARLEGEGWVDDVKFAEIWIAERQRTRPRSIIQLTAELAQKGIARSIIQSALATIDPGAELAAAQRLASQRTWTDLNKLRAYLARKGFRVQVIRQVISELVEAKQSSDSGLVES